VKQDLPEP